MSTCPRNATKKELALYLRSTAALADAYELRLSDVDT